MKSLGSKATGARLARMKASPLWTGEGFRNVHPIIPGLRDPHTPMPTISEFICGGERRVPQDQLPSLNPLEAWAKRPETGLRATWLGHSYGLDRDRRPACTHGSGVGATRIAFAPYRAQALSAGAYIHTGHAAD